MLAEVEALIAAHTEPVANSVGFCKLVEDMLDLEYDHKVSALEQEAFFATLEKLHQGAYGFQKAMLRNLGFCARNAWSFYGRDEGMTANLEYLALERFPKEKIVVWTHNYHIAKKSSLLAVEYHHHTVGGYSETLLGEGATARLDGVVSLALLSAEGWYHAQGNLEQRETFTTPAGTLEAELATNGLDYAYLDLHSAPAQPFNMSAIFHNAPEHKLWSEAFDGILFLRQITGLTS